MEQEKPEANVYGRNCNMARREKNMDILNQQVSHKKFGVGTVVEQTEDAIFVKFANVDKQFQYPSTFQKFLALNDKILQEEVLKEAKQKEQEKEQQKAEIRRDILLNRTSEIPQDSQDRPNVVFKCNYCDGGKSDTLMGFHGVCSDSIIQYNIKVEKRTWCSSPDCACLAYLQGEISRYALESQMDYGGFVCYESQMLREWKAMAGVVQKGERKGAAMRLAQVQANSLCILTTREPYTEEEERLIFAVFLVDRAYDGDSLDEGFVSTQSRFKLALSPQEAKKMPFWKYHANKSKVEKAFWGSGLHRYITNTEAVQILSDIAALKKGTEDEALAQEFLDVFCKVVNTSVEEAGRPEGVLMKRNVRV